MSTPALRPLGSRYRLVEVIGRGAMGEVWKGLDPDGRTVAVKVLLPHLAQDPAMVQRFVVERSALVRVKHPNIVGVRDLVIEGDTLAIVMDHVDGPDLRKYLARYPTLSPALACQVGESVAHGLQAVHTARILHRDIKPDNVLLDYGAARDGGSGPMIKITDFGVSRLIDDVTLSRHTALVGTPYYMAPELSDGISPSVQSDLYALGIMLYELICGVTPFHASSTMAVLRAHAERAPGRPDGFPAPLWDVVAWLLTKDPAQRPDSAANIADSLAALRPQVAGLEPMAPLSEPPAGPVLSAHGTGDAATQMWPASAPSAQSAGSAATAFIPSPGTTPGGEQSPSTVLWQPGPAPVAQPAVAVGPPQTGYPTQQPYPGTSHDFEPPPRKSRRGLVAVLVLALVALLGTAGGLWWAGRQRDNHQTTGTPSVSTGTDPSSAVPATSTAPTSQPPSTEPPSSSTPSSATATPSPSVMTDQQAEAMLTQLRSQSISQVKVDDHWVLQIAGKYAGITDPLQTTKSGSHQFQLADILAEHEQLKTQMQAKGVPVYLLNLTDFGQQTALDQGKVWWMTVADPGGITSKAQGFQVCATLFPDLSGDALANQCQPKQLSPPHS